MNAEKRGAVPRLRTVRDPAFAEDIESIAESLPYVIRVTEAEAAGPCARCGASVALVPESPAGTASREWHLAVWEALTGRKHTPRRCAWQRGRHAPASGMLAG